MSVRKMIVADDDDGQRLDRWLKKYVPDIPYGLAQKLIRKGQFRVDGKRAKSDTRLVAGQEIRVPPHQQAYQKEQLRAEETKLSDEDAAFIRSLVIYDDGHVIALNKPSGLACQGGSKVYRHVDGMLDALTKEDGVRPRLVHRLDKDTSGVLLLARSSKVAKALGQQFQRRSMKKIYWAIVSPKPELHAGAIKAPLIKSGGSNQERMVVDEEEGKYAVTEYEIVEHAHKQVAFVAFRPRTGRTHQIRVHSELIDCPVVGDNKYRGIPAEPGEHKPEPWDMSHLKLPKRLHLHAHRVICNHPAKNEILDITAPLADDLKKSWKTLGFDPNFKGELFAHVKK